MPVLDLVVVGCGGGPSESNLSSYLLKPCQARWSDGAVALEAGSGMGAVARILQNNPALFGVQCTAAEVISWIRSYVITHAHLDHINGLVLCAGSFSGPPRRIFGSPDTLKGVETVFSDRLWPNLASWDPADTSAALLYAPLPASSATYTPIAPSLSVRALPLSHGRMRSGATAESTAFFVRHDPSSHELLFFGDVEPDALSARPRTRAVWAAAAPLVPHALRTVFIECSYPAGRPDATLYGHLSPEHLAAELGVLAREVVAARRGASPARKWQRTDAPADELKGALCGVRVYITHCKEDLSKQFDQPINKVIAGQVRCLVEKQSLGVEILAAEQGMRITI